jgi:hypothetical protein
MAQAAVVPQQQQAASRDTHNADYLNYLTHRRQHPEVYDFIVDYSRKAKDAGYGKWSVSRCVEVIRWNRSINLGKDEAGFKINDHTASYYSREIQMREADLFGFYDVRRGEADIVPLVNGETWLEYEARMIAQQTGASAKRP